MTAVRAEVVLQDAYNPTSEAPGQTEASTVRALTRRMVDLMQHLSLSPGRGRKVPRTATLHFPTPDRRPPVYRRDLTPADDEPAGPTPITVELRFTVEWPTAAAARTTGFRAWPADVFEHRNDPFPDAAQILAAREATRNQRSRRAHA